MESSSSLIPAWFTKRFLWIWMVGFLLILVFGGVLTFFFWPEEADPSSVLLGSDVRVMIQGATEVHVAPYRALFPALRDAPAGTSGSTLVLLAHGGDINWILFEPRKNLADTLVNGGYKGRPWLLKSSASNPETLFATGSTLSSLPSFRSLLRVLDSDVRSFAYIDPHAIFGSDSTALDGMFQKMSETSGNILVWHAADGTWNIAFGTLLSHRIFPAFPALLPVQDGISFALANPAEALRFFEKALPGSTATVAEGMLRAWAAKWLGPEVSVEHDLLPLLQGPLSVSVAKTGTGALKAALRTNITGMHETEAQIAKLVLHFTSTLPQGTTKTFDVEKRFTSTILFPDANASNERTEEVNGLTMHVIDAPEAGRSLAYALNGQTLFLGDDVDLIKKFMETATDGASSVMDTTPKTFAEGSLSVPLLRQALHDLLGISMESLVFPSAQTENGNLSWRLDEQSGLPVLSFFVSQ